MYKQGFVIDDVASNVTYKLTKNNNPTSHISIPKLAERLEKFLQRAENKRLKVYNKIPILYPTGELTVQKSDGTTLEMTLGLEESQRIFTLGYVAETQRIMVAKKKGHFFYAILDETEMKYLFSVFKNPETMKYFE